MPTLNRTIRMADNNPLYTYTLSHDPSPRGYDESLAVACLQGIINRDSPELCVLSHKNERPKHWLDIMMSDRRWLADRELKPLPDLDALIHLAGSRLKGAVIWDPLVPASVNVATTIAGVHDLVALSPELHEKDAASIPVRFDLRNQFTGKITGSKKNDAYRWAIDQFLAKDLCSTHFLCLFEDSFSTRAAGNIGYVLTRDWAVKNRAFVFDLSPWDDEKPADDLDQPMGTDVQTYHAILQHIQRTAAGDHMTEMTGFFAFAKYSNVPGHKSRHDPVPTEWQSVWLISPYNVYQNTISSDCFNQSLHCHAPRKPLKQKFAAPAKRKLENKAYIAVLMADYDSATPLYEFLPTKWADPGRGKIPLIWGINPNLRDTYPDVFAYFYETASPLDTFASDASCAGYINPNRIAKESLPLFIQHNQKYFREMDMTIAPMVLDQNEPSDDVKDAFAQFSPDGFATIVQDEHGVGGHLPKPQVWKGMPIMELMNDTCAAPDAQSIATAFAGRIGPIHHPDQPCFALFRIVWKEPTLVADAFEIFERKNSNVKAELVDAHTFFGLFKIWKRMSGDAK